MLYFIDSKNYEKFFKEGQKDGLDILVGTPIRYLDGKLEKFYRDEEIIISGIITGKQFLELCFETNSYRMEVWDDIYRTSLIKENKVTFKEKLLHEDELFTPFIFSKAKKVKLIDIDFYYYRQREGSIMYTQDVKSVVAYIYIIKELSKLSSNKELKYLTKHIYRWYKELIIKYKLLYLKEHFILMINLGISFEEKIWFFKIIRYMKKTKLQIELL